MVKSYWLMVWITLTFKLKNNIDKIYIKNTSIGVFFLRLKKNVFKVPIFWLKPYQPYQQYQQANKTLKIKYLNIRVLLVSVGICWYVLVSKRIQMQKILAEVKKMKEF